MLSVALIVGALLPCVGVLFMFVASRRAPEGFEDETGFHVLESPKGPRRGHRELPHEIHGWLAHE
jgi:hypothetical protein